MKVTLFPCGPAANESECRAFDCLTRSLRSAPGDGEWVLLTNIAFSVTHQLQSDEIDTVAIGPPGVRVIEVKHWTAQWVDSHPAAVEQEADRLTNKARKIGTTLRKLIPGLPHVEGAFLLTQEASNVRKLVGSEVRGVQFHSLNGWKDAVGFDSPRLLTDLQVAKLARELEPRSAVAMDGSLRRLAGYVNLELQTPKDERLHRIYKGRHSVRQDRVVLHLYDLSATDDQNADAKARREFDALQRLQLYPWAPRILDSFQDAPGYEAEMYYFSLVDPAAPCIAKRAADTNWNTGERLAFARSAVQALAELHAIAADNAPMVHRNLTAETILVRHDNSPVLTGFDRAKIPADVTVAFAADPGTQWNSAVAPEVRRQGLGAADQRSDVYSLCVSLTQLFDGRDDRANRAAVDALAKGAAEEPERRCKLRDVETALSKLLGESLPPAAAPPARFWTEGQVVRFHDHDYRIVARLGSGGVGTTFKVVEIDRLTKEDLGTYVAKVGHSAETGGRVLKAYGLARSHLGRHPGLSAIFEAASEWQENQFIALMTWIEGSPLDGFIGVFSLLAEEQQETSAEALALRWLRATCEALDVLHRNGLVHGDISPRNTIVSGSDLVLTDYDFVAKTGEIVPAPGTVLYCSPSDNDRRRASPADDIYALAASFFHVVFDKEPFRCGGDQAKERGLNWEGLDRDGYTRLAAFLDKATFPEPSERFRSASEALAALRDTEPPAISVATTSGPSEPLQSSPASNTVGQPEPEPEPVPPAGCAVAPSASEVVQTATHGDNPHAVPWPNARGTLVLPKGGPSAQQLAAYESSKAFLEAHGLRAATLDEFLPEYIKVQSSMGQQAAPQPGETPLDDDFKLPRVVSGRVLRPVAEVAAYGAGMWLRLANWAQVNDVLEPRERDVVYNVGKRLREGPLPSIKQARWAIDILEKAKRFGFDPCAND